MCVCRLHSPNEKYHRILHSALQRHHQEGVSPVHALPVRHFPCLSHAESQVEAERLGAYLFSTDKKRYVERESDTKNKWVYNTSNGKAVSKQGTPTQERCSGKQVLLCRDEGIEAWGTRGCQSSRMGGNQGSEKGTIAALSRRYA